MKIAFRLACLFGVLSLATAAAAAPNPYDIPDAIDEQLRSALHELFNLEISTAEERVARLHDQKNEHPMIEAAEVLIQWSKLSANVLEADEAASQSFLDASNRCLRGLGRKTGTPQQRVEAWLAVGTTLGLLSRWSAANHSWITAYTRGSRSASILKDTLEANPVALDAFMTLGTYNYAREWLRERTGGKKEREEAIAHSLGLFQLRAAYQAAPYFGEASGIMLAGILTNDSPAEAVPLLRELIENLPRNGHLQMLLVTALYNSDQAEELAAAADELLMKVRTGEYDLSFEPQAFFANALVAFRSGDWAEAARLFRAAIDAGDESNPYTTWAYLYQGYCYDALGQRPRAVALYNRVLTLKPRYASREHAAERLRQPFRKSDVEMKKFEV